MNAKKAKLLRRIAREATVGQPDRRILMVRCHVDNPMTKARIDLMNTPVFDSEGKPTGGWGLKNYVPRRAVNDPDTTRGFYRAMKKGDLA